MKFEDIEHYMHEEHLRNEAAKFTADLMHSQEARRALHRARLQRAVAACFLLRPFVTNELMLGICIIMAAMPIGTMTSLFCTRYDGPVDTASAGIFLSTLLSIPAVPLIMALLF